MLAEQPTEIQGVIVAYDFCDLLHRFIAALQIALGSVDPQGNNILHRGGVHHFSEVVDKPVHTHEMFLGVLLDRNGLAVIFIEIMDSPLDIIDGLAFGLLAFLNVAADR